jgi:hypothetical protein
LFDREGNNVSRQVENFISSELKRQKEEIRKDLIKGLGSTHLKWWMDVYCDDSLLKQNKKIIKELKKMKIAPDFSKPVFVYSLYTRWYELRDRFVKKIWGDVQGQGYRQGFNDAICKAIERIELYSS